MYTKLFDYYQKLNRERLMLSVTGPISQEIVKQYGALLKSMESISENRRLVVLGVFVELAQNVLRYSEEKSGDVGLGVVVISEEDNCFRVSSGNLIPESCRGPLESSFEELAKLDHEALRSVYREKRREARKGTGDGAGLGLIELFKRCDSVTCEFEPVENDRLFFTVTAEVAKI
ncbi:MAG: SiaB family protein kinase [Puniceicoccales bacterium]